MHEINHAWHEQKSLHNYKAYKYLNIKSPEYVDWEIIVLFYAACNLIDAYFMKYIKKPKSHVKRNTMVEAHLPEIAEAYRQLYDLSRTARYENDVQTSDRDTAIASYTFIADKLGRFL